MDDGDSRELSRQLLAVLNGIPGLVGYWDTGLRNRFANMAYVDYFGLTLEHIHGMHMRDVIGNETFEANIVDIQRAAAGEPVTFDRTLIHRGDGTERHVQVSYIPDRDIAGLLHGFFALVTDVTERVANERAAHESLATWRSLARSMPAAFVLVYDRDLRFSIADGAELEALGLSSEQVEGRTVEQVFGSALAARYSPLLRSALEGETTQWEHAVGRRTFAVTAIPVQSDLATSPTLAMALALDVSAQRLNERIWSALNSIATEVARQSTPERVADLIAASLLEVFAVDSTAVIRYTGTGTADVVAVAPVDVRARSFLRFGPDDTSSSARVQVTERPVLCTFDHDADNDVSNRAAVLDLRCGAGAPIRYEGRLWGAVLLASTDPDGLAEDVLEPLMRFAELVELAIASTESRAVLSRLAELDELTGLPNRRVFNVRLRDEVLRSRRDGTPLSVAMLDLALFKRINDEHGHGLGDIVLTELGLRVAAVSRQHELMARLGGDEFAWLLPGARTAEAVGAAERLREAVSSTPFPIVGTLAVSVGVATLDATMDAPMLLEAADRALYLAKRSGRDTIVVIDEPEPVSS